MSRTRERVCLQDGLKLDLNRLARKGFIKHGANIGGRGITWTHSYWGDIATGFITADMSGDDEGWFRIQLGSLDQRIMLIPGSRHFGGRQWYFMCPVRNRAGVGALEAKRRYAILQPADPGADKSPINPNSTMRQAGLTLDKPRSIPGFALSRALIRKIGILHRNRSGCGGGPTIVMRSDLTATMRF